GGGGPGGGGGGEEEGSGPGGFDADGATSTAVAMLGLSMLGVPSVDFRVPSRFSDGYGLTPGIIHRLQDDGDLPDLLVTVDNGISAIEGVGAARELGIKVVITDHHLAGEELPDADAIVNPNQPGCPFLSKNAAGVGVMFYVLTALRKHLRDNNLLPDPEPNLGRSEEHTSELQSRENLVCRLLLE